MNDKRGPPVPKAHRSGNATLKDVALHAGLAVSTASRYLNGTLQLPPETRQRLQDAVMALNYQPNVLARNLQAGRSRTLGLVLPELSNPFFALLAEAASEAADRAGYTILLCVSGNDPAREERHVRLLATGQLDGLIYLGAHRRNEALQMLGTDRFPVVVVDEEVSSETAGRLFVDNRRGGYLATEHLLHLGHRDIAFLGGDPDLLTTQERLQGYRDALTERGVTASPARIRLGRYDSASGHQAATQWFSTEAPSAIFAASDMLALGVMQAAREHGLHVPRDLSLVGFDDVPVAALLSPALSTVWQPVSELGQLGVEMLVAYLEEGRALSTRTLGVRLVVRESTAPPAHPVDSAREES